MYHSIYISINKICSSVGNGLTEGFCLFDFYAPSHKTGLCVFIVPQRNSTRQVWWLLALEEITFCWSHPRPQLRDLRPPPDAFTPRVGLRAAAPARRATHRVACDEAPEIDTSVLEAGWGGTPGCWWSGELGRTRSER